MIAQGSQLLLKLIDDDGIQSVSVSRAEIREESDWNKPDNELTYINSDPDAKSGTEFVYSINMPSASGFYKFKLSVTDVNGKTTTVAPFAVYVTAAAPTIAGIKAEPTFISKRQSDKLVDETNYPSNYSNKPLYQLNEKRYSKDWKSEYNDKYKRYLSIHCKK